MFNPDILIGFLIGLATFFMSPDDLQLGLLFELIVLITFLTLIAALTPFN